MFKSVALLTLATAVAGFAQPPAGLPKPPLDLPAPKAPPQADHQGQRRHGRGRVAAAGRGRQPNG